MHPLASAILITWRRNGGYALRLVGDLSSQQWTAQPVPGQLLNHPAWVFSHLNIYTPICVALCRGVPFADPIDHQFGQKSEVSPDPSIYPPSTQLTATFQSLHAEAESALAQVSDDILARPNPLDRWRAVHPTVGDQLMTLMVKHEMGHLGQLSAWRRAFGMPRVAM